ncbi:DNA replication licensing factor MCM4 [Panicum miliaceum]|uniref:DNA replication licensing factor MCM4 n=1 Tax=Panicum miliaceum TaxID=4540 RepID=A0A3L6SJ69_PANMI|nr:DNA replication licensing factor MCM4 [Panicum miliaceum]
MASNGGGSSPPPASSPDASPSSPLPVTNSSPTQSTSRSGGRRRRGSASPYASSPSLGGFETPPHPGRRTPSGGGAGGAGGARQQRQNWTGRFPPTPSTPMSTDDIPPSSDAGEDETDGGGAGVDATPVFVWGTNISVQDVNAAILRFLRHFRDPRDAGRVDPVMDEGKYMRAIHRILELEGGESLDVDAHDVFDHDPDLYSKMMRYPLEVLAIFDIVLMDLVARIEPLFEKHIQTRIYNLKSSICLRNLNPSDIEKMVSIKGMIIRCSSVIPELKEAVFRCLVCGFYSEPVMVDRDKQIIKLQETPDEIPEGGTPHTVSVLMHDKLVDAGKPGDRVEITGIYRAMSIRVGPAQRTVKSIFKTYIDCLHIKKTDKSRLHVEDTMDIDKVNANKSTEEDFLSDKVEKLKELSKLPDIYDRLTRSLAPNIWELDDVKRGLLCQLLQYMHKLSPRGIYTSGRGSSAVGLTAYVTKDPETGETVLESGALVLSDKGVCCIDEFDKMSDNARSMLHEVMEQQTVSIAKAGIIASLNARTSVLACANPTESRYNPRLSVIDNIHLAPTLLSRQLEELEVLDLPTLVAYISYARKYIQPQLSDEAAEELTRGYVEMRKRGNSPGSRKKVITATARQIESLIRLSEALARMRFSEVVEVRDVVEAFRLLEVAMQQSATDHATGTIDMDLIMTGISASERQRRENLVAATRNLIMEKMQLGGPSMRMTELLEEMRKQSSMEIHLHDLRSALGTLMTEGAVVIHGDNVKRV